jgi:hypothetical protein
VTGLTASVGGRGHLALSNDLRGFAKHSTGGEGRTVGHHDERDDFGDRGGRMGLGGGSNERSGEHLDGWDLYREGVQKGIRDQKIGFGEVMEV